MEIKNFIKLDNRCKSTINVKKSIIKNNDEELKLNNSTELKYKTSRSKNKLIEGIEIEYSIESNNTNTLNEKENIQNNNLLETIGSKFKIIDEKDLDTIKRIKSKKTISFKVDTAKNSLKEKTKESIIDDSYLNDFKITPSNKINTKEALKNKNNKNLFLKLNLPSSKNKKSNEPEIDPEIKVIINDKVKNIGEIRKLSKSNNNFFHFGKSKLNNKKNDEELRKTTNLFSNVNKKSNEIEKNLNVKLTYCNADINKGVLIKDFSKGKLNNLNYTKSAIKNTPMMCNTKRSDMSVKKYLSKKTLQTSVKARKIVDETDRKSDKTHSSLIKTMNFQKSYYYHSINLAKIRKFMNLRIHEKSKRNEVEEHHPFEKTFIKQYPEISGFILDYNRAEKELNDNSNFNENHNKINKTINKAKQRSESVENSRVNFNYQQNISKFNLKPIIIDENDHRQLVLQNALSKPKPKRTVYNVPNGVYTYNKNLLIEDYIKQPYRHIN